MENGRESNGMITGTFIGHPKGFGFVRTEGQKEDLFVAERDTGGAFHQDTVEAAVLSRPGRGKRQEARIVRILKRGMPALVGTFERTEDHFGFVKPDNPRFCRDIFVSGENSFGAVTGHKVVVQIADYGTNGKNPEGRIVEILGHRNEPGVDVLSIVKEFDLPVEFPQEVLRQAAAIPQEITETVCRGRRDLRDALTITIDGEDTKDRDDAVSLHVEEGQYHLGIHIADVAAYVAEGSSLDREALKRGTSVYLADRVIPMLPPALSNGICSLNEGVDRLTLSCLMTIDGRGEITDYEICESVIRVDRCMTYTAVQALLTEDPGTGAEEFSEKDLAVVPMLGRMKELAELLRARRKKRGSVDFDFPECKIRLDKKGRPVAVEAYERNAATDLIEDFMLAANETVAQHFYWLDVPFVYRVHDTPEGERIRKLVSFIGNLGYSMKAVGRKHAKVSSEEVHPKEIQKLLAKTAGTPQETLIGRLALRSMKQAKYSTECTGHFGLACGFYCHFTSPIRRYPDLQIHRIIKEQLKGELGEDRAAHYRSILPEVAKRSSQTERQANEAERETEKLKKAQFMRRRIGQCFDGVISGITDWGIYVELPNTVEGLVPVAGLKDDYYVYHENTYEMVGEVTGRVFRLGMPLRVRVEDCDLINRTIDFSLAED